MKFFTIVVLLAGLDQVVELMIGPPHRTQLCGSAEAIVYFRQASTRRRKGSDGSIRDGDALLTPSESGS